MKIGVIKELKDKENRVALTPSGAKRLIAYGHSIVLEKDAGIGSGFSNAEYENLGVEIVGETATAWDADLVIKVKEPLEQAYQYFKDNILFTYLHLAGVSAGLTKALLEAKTTAIAYETVEDDCGAFPLLTPMSAVAGNMAATVGAYYLANFNQGKGVLLGNVFNERHGKVMVLGDGVVGQHAAITADGMGAIVYLFGLNEDRFQQMKKIASPDLKFVQSTPENIAEHIKDTDLLIGAVLLAGAKAPHIITEAMVKTMQPGSVIVDVSIDQGGCIETAHATKHSDPVYIKHGVIHYCVSNMPGAYPRTSTIALTNATLPYILKLANQGITMLQEDKGFGLGVNTYKGWITCKPAAEALGQENQYKAFTDITEQR
jgi:alanine dehydrogenase